MAQINLLPWREQARQAMKTRFLYLVCTAVVIALLFVLMLKIHSNNLMSEQAKRNAFLQSELDREQRELTSMNEEKQKKNNEEQALITLFALRAANYKVIGILDQIAKTTPEGITLTKIVRNGKNILMTGRAASNSQVTLYIKNIANPSLFKQPELTEISSKELGSGEELIFQLSIEIAE